MNKGLWVAGFALWVAATGCKETVSGENIRTQGIAMLADVLASGNGKSTVTAELRVGGNESNTFVKLEGGDRLVAIADGEEKTMQAIDDGIYEARFDTDAEDTEFEIHFERVGDDDAKGTSGKLPAPFEVTSDLSGTFSRDSDDLEVTWEPSGFDDDMELEIREIGCIDKLNEDVDDVGEYLVEAGSLVHFTDDDDSEPEVCDAEGELARSRSGKNDEALDPESWFILRQIRKFEFNSEP